MVKKIFAQTYLWILLLLLYSPHRNYRHLFIY